jgi:putative flippase GtrA
MEIFNCFKNNKIIRYIISGGTAAFLHLSILYGLVHCFNVWYLLSTSIAFCIAVTANYFMQKFFTFKNHSKRGSSLQFSIFFFFSFFILCLNGFSMYLLVEIAGFWYFLAQIVVSSCAAFVSYLFYNKIVFKTKKEVLS